MSTDNSDGMGVTAQQMSVSQSVVSSSVPGMNVTQQMTIPNSSPLMMTGQQQQSVTLSQQFMHQLQQQPQQQQVSIPQQPILQGSVAEQVSSLMKQQHQLPMPNTDPERDRIQQIMQQQKELAAQEQQSKVTPGMQQQQHQLQQLQQQRQQQQQQQQQQQMLHQQKLQQAVAASAESPKQQNRKQLAQQQLQRLKQYQLEQQQRNSPARDNSGSEDEVNLIGLSSPGPNNTKTTVSLTPQHQMIQLAQQQQSGVGQRQVMLTNSGQKQQYILMLPGGGKASTGTPGNPQAVQMLNTAQTPVGLQRGNDKRMLTPQQARKKTSSIANTLQHKLLQQNVLLQQKTPAKSINTLAAQVQGQQVIGQTLQVNQPVLQQQVGQSPQTVMYTNTNPNVQYRVLSQPAPGQPQQYIQNPVSTQQGVNVGLQQTSLFGTPQPGPSPKRQRKNVQSKPKQGTPVARPGNEGMPRPTNMGASQWSNSPVGNSMAQAGNSQGPQQLQTNNTPRRPGPGPQTSAAGNVSHSQVKTPQQQAKQQLQQLNQRMAAPMGKLNPSPQTRFQGNPRMQRPATPQQGNYDQMTPNSQGMTRTPNGNLGQQMGNRMAMTPQMQMPGPHPNQSTSQAGMPQQSQPNTPARSAPTSTAATPQSPQSIPGNSMGNMQTSNLMIGEEYVIQYSNGRKVVGTWDGKFFKIKPAGGASQGSGSNVTPSPSSQGQQVQSSQQSAQGDGQNHVAGGGAGGSEVRQQQTATNNVDGGNNQQWQGNADNLARPPIHNTPQIPEEPPKPKRPPRPTEAGKFAVCNNCGTYSANYDICDACHKILPDDVKYYFPDAPKKALPNATIPPTSQPQQLANMQTAAGNKVVMDKKVFYGAKLAEQGQVYGGPIRKVNNKQSGKKTPKKGAGRGRGRQPEIETVTILSSEDEEDGGASGCKSATPDGGNTPQGQQMPQQLQPTGAKTIRQLQAQQQQLTPEIQQQLRQQHQQALQQVKPSPRSNRNVNPLLQGHALPPQTPVPRTPLQPGTTVLVKTRSIRIGTMKTSSSDPVSFNTGGLTFVMTLPDTTRLQVLLPAKELTGVFAHFGRQMPVLFVMVSASCAAKIRTVFNMKPGSEPYFDPDSRKACHRRITFLLSAMTDEVQRTIVQICHHIQLENVDFYGDRLLTELDHETANKFLVQSTQTEEHHYDDDEEEEPMDRSRSPSPPRVFCGSIVKLFTYPPAPATGGITVTNEDLFCLNDGEFLNDVIIDFYLKYLFMDHLKAEYKARTHVFSSFFYRRLTQKQSRRGDESANMTPAQRRHSRVKTWTRHVDLFDKDFIVVPINESAHWYLAIICFPGVVAPVLCEPSGETSQPGTPRSQPSQPGTPKSDKGAVEQEGEKNDSPHPGTSDGGQGDGQANSGKENGKKATSKKPNKKSVQKQPCILMFDSLAGPSRSCVIRTLRDYLQVEWDLKKKAKEGERLLDKDTFKGATMKAPQQTNFSDCGVYVLQYVESFFMTPLVDYSIPFPSMVDWFTDDTVVRKREDLRCLIMELQAELNPELQYDPSADGCQVSMDSTGHPAVEHSDGAHTGSSAPQVVTGAQPEAAAPPPLQAAPEGDSQTEPNTGDASGEVANNGSSVEALNQVQLSGSSSNNSSNNVEVAGPQMATGTALSQFNAVPQLQQQPQTSLPLPGHTAVGNLNNTIGGDGLVSSQEQQLQQQVEDNPVLPIIENVMGGVANIEAALAMDHSSGHTMGTLGQVLAGEPIETNSLTEPDQSGQ